MQMTVDNQVKQAQDFIHSFGRFKSLMFLTSKNDNGMLVTRWSAYYKDVDECVTIDINHTTAGLSARYKFEDEDEWRQLK